MHRAGRRNQLIFSGAALLCTHRAKVQRLASPAKLEKFMMHIRGLLPVLLYLDMSTGAAGAAVPMESYLTTLPSPSRAPSPVTNALAVELNRATVRLLPRRVCFCSFGHLFFSCVAFFPFSLFFCFTLGCTYYRYAFNSRASTRAAAAVFTTCSIVLLGCCCCC